MMTPEMIATIQNSFDRVFPVRDEFALTFYGHLFASTPQLRPLFAQDMLEQRLKLSDTLAYIVRNLAAPEIVEETIVGLARRHVRYGATADHFAPVGMALIQALRQHLPGGMSDAEAEAWLDAYTFIADLMIDEMTSAA